MKVILLSEDSDLSGKIFTTLSLKNVIVDVVSTSILLEKYLDNVSYDLIMLDVSIPNVDTLELCYKLQSVEHPLMLLLFVETLDSQVEVAGLNAGADDCLRRSVDADELLAHVTALLRRRGQKYPVIGHWGEFLVDCSHNQVSYEGTIIPLTAKEYQLFTIFLAAPDQTLNPQALINQAWSSTHEQPGLETVKTHIRSLRLKFKKVGLQNLIETIYGFGYRLNQELMAGL